MTLWVAETYEALPPGLYVGELLDIESRESANGQYRRWCWEILEGPYAGRKVYANTSTNFGPQAKPRQWVENILGRELEGELNKGRYDARVRTLKAEAHSARGELEKLKARRQMITQSQSDMKELVDSYAKALPDDLASLTGSERHEVYRILNLRVDLDNSGIVELGGVVAFPQNKDHIET